VIAHSDLVRLSEVQLERVGKRHGAAWAVRDVSFAVRPGELYALLGGTASGKTTVLRMLAGLETPDVGRIVVDDEPIDAVPIGKRRIGMVFREYALWPHMSLFDHVAYGLRARGDSRDAIAARVRAALEQVELRGSDTRRPSELSSGERHRLALARALAVEPRLLLLDEPFAPLEPAVRAEMRRLLVRLQKEIGITTILAARDHADALSLASRVAVLSGGTVVQEGRPEDVYWRPKSRVVAELVGVANLVPVRVVELREVGVVVETAGRARVPVASGGHAWTLGAPGLLCLRPESLVVEEAALSSGGIPGTVRDQVFEGARQLYEVDITGGTLRVEALTSALQVRTLKPGDHVKVRVSPESSVLLPDEAPEARSRR
jgi:ABC-type Fe3+/spermidine/putrescine transport system ATPase subunit